MGWFSSSKPSTPKQPKSCEEIRLKYFGYNNDSDIQACNKGCGVDYNMRCAFLKDLPNEGNITYIKTCLYFEEAGSTREEARRKASSSLINRSKCSYYTEKAGLDSADFDFINSKK